MWLSFQPTVERGCGPSVPNTGGDIGPGVGVADGVVWVGQVVPRCGAEMNCNYCQRANSFRRICLRRLQVFFKKIDSDIFFHECSDLIS